MHENRPEGGLAGSGDAGDKYGVDGAGEEGGDSVLGYALVKA